MLAVNRKSGKLKEMKRYRGKDFAIMAGLGFLGLFLYSALYYYDNVAECVEEAYLLSIKEIEKQVKEHL